MMFTVERMTPNRLEIKAFGKDQKQAAEAWLLS